MAPRKPTSKRSTPAAMPTKKPGGRITKQKYPKVRWHESGLLDVERKNGKYLKIAKRNHQESPLLRLPAEIRNRIFEYALGGKTFRMKHKKIANKKKNFLSLSRVCRQIYAETAIVPFRMNTFYFKERLDKWLEAPLQIQWEAISSIQLFVTNVNGELLWDAFDEVSLPELWSALPGLKRARFKLYCWGHPSTQIRLTREFKEKIRASNKQVKITFTRMKR